METRKYFTALQNNIIEIEAAFLQFFWARGVLLGGLM